MARQATIGELAGEAGIAVQTVRYYERIVPALAEPPATPAGHRCPGTM